MPAACRRERTIARRSQPPRRTSTRKPRSCPHRFAQIAHQNEPVVTSKCTSGRPLLTGTAPQTEFDLTRRKQTTEKFLTGTRTHIRIFNFSPFTTQNPSQLIQRLPAHLEEKSSEYSAGVNSLLSRLPAVAGRFTRASLRFCTRPAAKVMGSAAFLPGSAQNVESDVTYSKQTLGKFLPGATTAHSASTIGSSL